MEFKGFRRPDGRAGIRSHVLVMPSVVCANRVARGISRQVAGTNWIEHQHGCTQLGADADLTAHVLVSHGTHPNVYGVVVVGLGCETTGARGIAERIKELCPYKPVHLVVIQDEGGSLKATAAGAAAAREMVIGASMLERVPMDSSELILGTECGGSDACSGISANPALGVANDMLIDAGGAVILAETTEIIADMEGKKVTARVVEKIPFGHKFAVRAIKKGEPVIKYGEVIGLATQEILPGRHVHVHNLESCRGRGDKQDAK